jgi:hypothetical protein
MYSSTLLLTSALEGGWGWASVVFKALRYNSQGPGIVSRCRRGFIRGIWQFHVPWGRLSRWKWVSGYPGGKGGRCLRPTAYHLHVPMSRNLGALTSWNPVDLFRPVMGQLFTRRRWGVSITPRPQHNPGKDPVPIVQEAGWVSGPVRTGVENLAIHQDSIPGSSSP